MSRTNDMLKTAKRIGQVHKSQKHNSENMNNSTRDMTILKNELYVILCVQNILNKFIWFKELYFKLENSAVLLSDMKELSRLVLSDSANTSNFKLEQIKKDKILEDIIEKGNYQKDIQGRARGIQQGESSLILDKMNEIKLIIEEYFSQQGYQAYNMAFSNFSRCQYPLNLLFENMFTLIEIEREEKEFICLNSSIPGIIELLQARQNGFQSSKHLIFTPFINNDLKGIADLKIEIISEVTHEEVEGDIITLMQHCQGLFARLIINNTMIQQKILVKMKQSNVFIVDLKNRIEETNLSQLQNRKDVTLLIFIASETISQKERILGLAMQINNQELKRFLAQISQKYPHLLIALSIKNHLNLRNESYLLLRIMNNRLMNNTFCKQ